jgi:Mg/Co/Ni transporter MgtE
MTTPEDAVATLRRSLSAGGEPTLRELLLPLHPADVPHLMESLPASEREGVWQFLPEETASGVLPQSDVALLIERRELVSAAVVDGRLYELTRAGHRGIAVIR